MRRAADRGYSYFHLYLLMHFLCVYVSFYVCHASWPNEKRYRPEIWYTHSPRPNLKTAFFEKATLRAASLEKLLCQVDFPHISSIAFFMYLFIYLCHASWQKEKRYRPEIRYIRSSRLHLETGFFVVSKKWPWVSPASKNCRVTWIFRISPRLPCLSKSTWGEQPVEDISKFKCICAYLFMYLFVSRLQAKRKMIQTWNLPPLLPLIVFSKNHRDGG